VPQSKIVVHFQDGRVVKGFTSDFAPARPRFHLSPLDAAPGTRPLDIEVPKLKAIYIVKDFGGDPERDEGTSFESGAPVSGRRVRVVFQDGEVLVGTTQGYHPERPGFFVIPADPASNNERCFIVVAATREVSFLL
jgi:hypothetical protein